MSQNKICNGCGSTLQSNDPKEKGYVIDLNKHFVCKRCFDIKNYNKIDSVRNISNEDVSKLLKNIEPEKQNIFYVVDILNIDVKMMKILKEISATNTLYIVINKIDILPKSLKFYRIDNWIKSILDKEEVFYYKLIYSSSTKRLNIDLIVDEISTSPNIYNHFVGVANVGKSSIINAMKSSMAGARINDITTSIAPGTTIGIIENPVNDKKVYDYPGIYLEGSYQNILDKDDISVTRFDKEIKPINYGIHMNQSIMIDRAAIFTLIESEENKHNFQIYANGSLKLHKTNSKNIERILVNEKEKFLINEKFEYVTTTFKLEDDGAAYDFILPDIARVRWIGNGQKIEVKHIKGTTIELKESFIPYTNNDIDDTSEM